MSLGMNVAFEKKLSIFSEAVKASNFLVKLRINDQVEVIIDLLELSDVFILHLPPGRAFPAGVIGLREADLIDDNIVNIDFELGEFDGESFSFIKR